MTRCRFTLIDLIICIMALAFLVFAAGMFMPVLSHSPESRRLVNCAGNLKQIGLSALMYSGDYGGYFPNLASPALGSGGARFGYWAPLPTASAGLPPLMVGNPVHPIQATDDLIWACPSTKEVKSDAETSNYRYIGSGRKDDNDSATLVTLGYDASGNHPKNAWMNALFIDGHVERAKPDGSKVVTFNIPGGPKTSAWNRNDW
jgi:prepilin-type processing-associated H-X9-DG protein